MKTSALGVMVAPGRRHGKQAESELDEYAKKFGMRRIEPTRPHLEVRLTHPNQTPAQYAECFALTLVPARAWQPEHMRAAQRLVDAGEDPERIGLFVVGPG